MIPRRRRPGPSGRPGRRWMSAVWLLVCCVCALKASTATAGADVGAARFDRGAFADAVAAQMTAVAAGGAPRRRFFLFLDLLAKRNGLRAKPKEPFASITPGCQRMQNYYFSTCVYAPPMLRMNNPREVPLGE